MPSPGAQEKNIKEIDILLEKGFENVVVFNPPPSGGGYAVADHINLKDVQLAAEKAGWKKEDVSWVAEQDVDSAIKQVKPVSMWNYKILWRRGWAKLFD